MATAAKARTLRCSHCSAPIEIRGGPRSRVIVCEYCDSAMDLTDPNFSILWRYEQKVKFPPAIPLGKRGTIRGEKLECIGFVRRSTTSEGEQFGWSEYLLFSPYLGYRWLVEEEGQWSLARESMALPTTLAGDLLADVPPRANIKYQDNVYRHFQSSLGRVDYCIGEFYWAITVGQETQNSDYIAPPLILSAEIAPDEITWSCGEYIPADEVMRSFGLDVPSEAPSIVAANQPNPIGRTGPLWILYFMYCAVALLITVGFSMMSKGALVFHKEFAYYANQKERSFVTDYFTIPGGSPATLEVTAKSSLSNRWAWYHISLINEDSGTAIDFGIENARFSGVEDGESWSEGSDADTVVLPHVPPGRYYMLVDPQSGTTGEAEPFRPDQPDPGAELFKYQIDARSDVVLWSLFFYAALLLLPIPVIQSIRSWAFEARRWSRAE